MDYVAVQKSGDISDPRARGAYLKSGFVSALTPKMVDTLVDGFEPDPGRNIFVGFQHAGGAVARVSDDATAFAHRYVAFDTLFLVDWAMGSDPAAHIQYLRDYFARYEAYTEGFYTNDVALDETQQKINRNYRGNYERLVGLKTKYDPTNLFRLNANIPPRAA
jgi:FAD/FMN-containing dehydrogenase